jgi:hypothetical protein
MMSLRHTISMGLLGLALAVQCGAIHVSNAIDRNTSACRLR